MPIKTRTSRALVGTITSILQYAVLMILQFLLVPVVLKFAGKDALGTYSFLLQIIGWAALTDLGFGVSISRSLAQSHGEENHFHFVKVFTTGRSFYVGSNLVFALIVYVIGLNLDAFISVNSKVAYQARLCMYLLATWIIIRTPLSLYGEALTATQNIASVNLIILFSNIFRMAFSVLLVYLGAGLIGLIISYIASECMTMYLQKRKYMLLFPHDKFEWGFPDLILFKKMFGFGLMFMLMSIASRLSSSSDSLILGNLLGASSVSIFYVSQMPGTLLYQLIWKLTDNSAPAINELFYKGYFENISEVYFKLLRYSLLLAVPLAFGLLFFNKSFVSIWTGNADNFAGNSFTLALAIYSITQVVIHLNAIMLVAIGDINKMSFFTIIFSVLRVIIAFIVIPKQGIKGIMITNVILDLPLLIYFHYKLFQIIKISSRHFLYEIFFPVIKSNFILFILLILFYVFKIELEIYSLVISILSFGLIFILCFIFIGITFDERIRLFEFSKKIFQSRLHFKKALE